MENGRVSRLFTAGWGLVFLLAMHLTMPNVGGAGIILPFNALTWLAWSVPLGIALYAVQAQGEIKWHGSMSLLLLAAFLLTVPVLYPHSAVPDAALRLAGLWLGCLMLVLLTQPALGTRWMPGVLLLVTGAVWIQSLAGYAQLYWLEPGNWLFYLVRDGRPVGIFNQPNLMASFLATGLAVSGYWVTQPAQWGPSLQQRPRIRKIIDAWVLATPLITLPLLTALGSRTGWLVSGAVLLGLLMYWVATRSVRKSLGLWLAAALVGLVLGQWMQQADERISARVESKTHIETPRYTMYAQALDLIQERPWSGWGYGRFEPAMVEYAAVQRETDPDYPPAMAALTHPHNEVLYWVSEGGVLPLLGFLLLGGLGVGLIARQPRGSRLPGLLLVAPVLGHTQLELPLYVSSIHWLTLVVLLGLLWRRAQWPWRTVPFSQAWMRPVLRGASLLIPGLMVLVMVTTLHTNHLLNQFQQQVYRELSDLDDVSNTFVWRDRVDWLRFYSALSIGVSQQNETLVNAYTLWAEPTLSRKPRPEVIQNLITAYDVLGRTEDADNALDRANRWYPTRAFERGAVPELDLELDTTSGGAPLLN